MKNRVGNLATNPLIAQWVQATEPSAAEASFFKINQKAQPIDPTERRILQARNAPNAIAARAIVRGGAGHKYWASFDPKIQTEIEQTGKELYEALYSPSMGSGAIKSLDMPVAGRGYNTLPFIFDLVNLTNGVPLLETAKAKTFSDALPDDLNGAETIKFLKRVKRRVQMVTTTEPSSLGVQSRHLMDWI